MKKLVAIILLCLLAANVSGMTLSYHYCGKILQYFAFNGHKKKSKCCCKGTQQKKGCCKTTHFKVSTDDGKSLAKQINFSKNTITEAILTAHYFPASQEVCLPSADHIVSRAHAPPDVRSVSIFILNQQFLI